MRRLITSTQKRVTMKQRGVHELLYTDHIHRDLVRNTLHVKYKAGQLQACGLSEFWSSKWGIFFQGTWSDRRDVSCLSFEACMDDGR